MNHKFIYEDENGTVWEWGIHKEGDHWYICHDGKGWDRNTLREAFELVHSMQMKQVTRYFQYEDQ